MSKGFTENAPEKHLEFSSWIRASHTRFMSHVGDAFGRTQHQTGTGATDAFGLHLNAFGAPPPDDFFSLLGRFLAVGSSMEYLLDRLGDLPRRRSTAREGSHAFGNDSRPVATPGTRLFTLVGSSASTLTPR